jgi:hypothetical protein
MNKETSSSPGAVRLIGWLFIIGAGLMVISAGMGLAGWALSRQVATQPMDLPKGGGFGGPISLFRNFWWLALAQIGVAGFIIYASIQFMKLRAWARAALEIVAWIGLTFGLGFGIHWAFGWLDMTTNVPKKFPGRFEHFRYLVLAAGMFGILFWIVPVAVVIGFLRGKTIRQAMVKTVPPPVPVEKANSGGGQE